MVLDKFPKIGLKVRLKQLFCKHETMSKGAFREGINGRKGYITLYILVESVSITLQNGLKKKILTK